jgi:hypothetical protein
MTSKNIILSIYYSGSIDPQRKKYQKNNNFAYIKNFYDSIVKNKLSAVIFHDELSDNFIAKYQNENIIFMPIPKKTYGLTSMNDIRFMVYLDYLLENKQFENIIISDAADVIFNSNVFDDITIKDKLYVCYDRNRTFQHYHIIDRIKLTYGSIEPFNGYMNNKLLQAGLFAGHYDVIVECLTLMKNEFDNMVDKTYNTNYVVFNHVAYSRMVDKLLYSSDGTSIKTKCGKDYRLLDWKI